MALVGVVLVALGLAPRVWVARELKRRGRPARLAWRRVYLSSMVWFGLILVVGAVSPAAAKIVLGVVVVWAMVVVGELLVWGIKGVWRLPVAIRLIGDPESWKGIRHPYWAPPQASERPD